MRVLRSISFVILAACATAMLSAQQTKASTPAPAKAAPAPSPAVPAPATVGKDTKGASPAAEPAKPESTPPDSYAYDPGGRRDPFLTLIGPANNARNGTKIDSASGIAVAELSVRGVLESRGKLVAMVKGPDNKTYIVHQGDKLLDGAIKSITPLGLVIEQEVNDPLSVVKQREVRKLLRGLEDAK